MTLHDILNTPNDNILYSNGVTLGTARQMLYDEWYSGIDSTVTRYHKARVKGDNIRLRYMAICDAVNTFKHAENGVKVAVKAVKGVA